VSGPGFVAEPAEDALLKEVGAQDPGNPFATPAFFESQARLGLEPWVLGIRDGRGQLQSACGAFLKKGRLECKLEIPSLSRLPVETPFWDGLAGFRRMARVTRLVVGTFGSPAGAYVPDLGPRCTRRERTEWVLDLPGDRDGAMASNHRRNLKRAVHAGLEVRRDRSEEALESHNALMAKSMSRRRVRGEDVGEVGPSTLHRAYLRTGAGELFQATRDGETLASVLVLRAPSGGYYHSSGASPDGMAMGAAHFLVHAVCGLLENEGTRSFNLGGAPEGTGLARFKGGFGAVPVRLANSACDTAPTWLRWARKGTRLLQAVRGD
jgi:hypothetical protein